MAAERARVEYTNIAFFLALEELAGAFSGRLVLLKGAALLASGYRRLGEREMGDADVLVRPGERRLLREALETLGYSRMAGCESSWIRGLVPVDVHDALWYLEPAETEALIAGARPVALGERRAWVPAPEEHLIFILAHAASTVDVADPKWAEDVRAVARSCAGELDLPAVGARLERLGLRPLVRWYLRRSGLEELERGFWGAGPAPWADRAAARALDRSRAFRHDGILRLAFLRGWRSRARYAAERLFPSEADLRERYGVSGRWKVPLWRVLRPISLAGRVAWDLAAAPFRGR